MKNKIPDNSEWEKIVEEAFSSDRRHVFSERYNMKKQSMRKGITMKKNNMLMNITVTAAALAVVAFPTGIYLSTRTAETSPSTQMSAKQAETPETATEQFYALEMGWLPEGLEYQSESEAGYCYGLVGEEVKVLAQFMKNTNAVPMSHILYHENTVMTDESESYNRHTVINYYASYNEEEANPENVGREVFVVFKGTDYFANLIVTDDISKDDLLKIIENIKLVPSDKETAQDYRPSNLTAVATPDGSVNNETFYALEMGWLPEGFEQLEENEEGICYGKSGGEAEITVLFLKNTSDTPITFNPDSHIVDTAEAGISDGRSFVINYNDSYDEELADPDVRGRRAMVAFDGTNYLVRLIVTDSISKNDLNKIIDEMKLVPSDKETAQDYRPSNLTAVEVSDGEDDGEEEKIYKVEYGWLPEGMKYNKSGPYGSKLHNDITGGGITPSFIKNVSGEKLETERNFTVLQEYKTDGKSVEITYRDDYDEELASPDNYGRIAMIYFDDTPYILSLWVTDEISRDDLKKIIENVKLVPTKFETASVYPPEDEEPEPYTSSVNADDCTIYKIGDEISEPDPDKKGNISVKVNSVRFQDNLDGLEINRHRLQVDPNKYLDENGKIVDRQMNCENENYEVVGSISIPCHVMVVNLTYTNHDDETIDYMIGPQINHKFDDGTFDNENPMWIEEMEKNPVYSLLTYDFDHNDLFSDFTYFSISSEKFGEFDDVVLAPDESAEVQLAFCVRDDMRDNMYLNINGYLENNSTNLVDLSNLK